LCGNIAVLIIINCFAETSDQHTAKSPTSNGRYDSRPRGGQEGHTPIFSLDEPAMPGTACEVEVEGTSDE